MSAIASVGSLL